MNALRFAIRQFLKNGGLTGVAVLTLALGIGITSSYELGLVPPVGQSTPTSGQLFEGFA